MARRSTSGKGRSPTRNKPLRSSTTHEQEPSQVSNSEQVSGKPDVKVTFLHVGEDTRLPDIMVQSVKDALGGVEIIQMTDMVSPEIKGVTGVSRRVYDGNLMTFRMEHLAALEGNWITLDTDIVVLKDFRDVFDKDFDVALTKRTGQILDPDGNDIAAIMPFNTGVMFSRNQSFWTNALKVLKKMPESAHKWWGDQLSVRLTAETGVFNVLELDCDDYNYSPNTETSVKDCYVVHYKGKRKEWMLNGNHKLYRTANGSNLMESSE